MEKDRNVFFLFSASQLKMRKEAEKIIGRDYKPGTVLVQGRYKQYTEMVNTLEETRYPDAVVVAQGSLSSFKYKK